MRLTLRTLLAYLDDTLDAADIKGIGEKVAESDNAQELVERIKQVTRRRRLTTPPDTGPGAFDPNDVADYLDSELAGEKVNELEKLCLESDVHLAEIATCHQILTLVLGEPALVPPKAKERMYKLVSGRESIPYRKAGSSRPATLSGIDTEEEELIPGDNWLRWVLPAAGILLVLVLGIAVWQLMRVGTNRQVAVNPGKVGDGDAKPTDKEKPPPVEPAKDAKKDKTPEKEKDRLASKDKEPVKDPPTDKLPPKDKDPDKDKGKASDPVRVKPPSVEKGLVGSYRGTIDDQPTGLAARRVGEGWVSVANGAKVSAGEPLVALPGLLAAVETDRKALLVLRGSLPAFALFPEQFMLLESHVVLHKNDEFDADVTLVRGRLHIRNNKERDAGELKVRLRFETETWDLKLPRKGDEVMLWLLKAYRADINHRAGEEPACNLLLWVVGGDVEVKPDAFQTFNLEADEPKTMFMKWDSHTKTDRPQRLPSMPPFAKLSPPPLDAVQAGVQREDLKASLGALKDLELRLTTKKPGLALREMVGLENPTHRALGIYGMAALDEIDKLVEALGNDDPGFHGGRAAAVFAIRHWLALNAGQYRRLYDKKTSTGVLVDKKFKSGESGTIADLLFDLEPKNWFSEDTFKMLAMGLGHQRTEVAELAWWHLQRFSAGAKLPVGFNAGASREQRQKYAGLIDEMIQRRQLPPPPPEMPKGK